MKRFICALAFLATPLFGETVAVGNLRGLNDADAAFLINDTEAQDLLNVDVTDNGYGIKKRDGFAQFKTVGVSTHGVRGGYWFRDISGSDTYVVANDRTVQKSVDASAFTAFITTDTSGSYYDFTDSQGYLWRATSNRDEIARYDGTDVTYFPDIPKGDQIEAMPDRLAISGSAANPNQVAFSQAADFTNFATGGLEEVDPFTENFGLPGQNITAIKYVCGDRLLVWTKNTISFWSGTNQYDGVIQSISNTIGTLHPDSIIEDLGLVFFQAQDGHFYSYDCNVLAKMSRSINGSVDGFVRQESKELSITSQSDFEAGTFDDMLSATASPGSLVYSDGIVFDDFSDGDLILSPTWSDTTSEPLAVSTAQVTSGSMVVAVSSTSGFPIYAGSFGTDLSFSTGAVSFDLTPVNLVNQMAVFFSTSSVGSDYKNGAYIVSFGVASAALGYYDSIGSFNVLGSTSTSNPSGVTQNFKFERNANGLLSLYKNGSLIISATDSTYNTFKSISFGIYVVNAAQSASIDNVKVIYTTSSYLSDARTTSSSIGSWGAFSALDFVQTGSTITYVLYGDTDSSIDITDPGTFVSSQTISNNDIPTIPVASFIRIGASFTRFASSQSISLNELDLQWFDGVVTRTFGTVDNNHRLLWSVAENGSDVNNVEYIYDQRFDAWLKYDVPMDAPVLIGEKIYFGDPESGIVYRYPSGTSDDGLSITSYWKSKDFIGSDPFVEKDWTSYSIIGKAQAGSNLDFTYSQNTLTGTVLNYSLTDSDGISFKRINGRFPLGTMGTFINVKFGNDDADAPFEVYTFRLDHKPRPWRVIP